MSNEMHISRTSAHAWPRNPSAFVTSAQVANYLGYPSLKAFYNHKAWRERHGFPRQAIPRRWRAGQIEAWEAARINGTARQIQPANDTGPARPPVSAREKLAALQAALNGAPQHG